jgi:rhamnose transport system permease protein
MLAGIVSALAGIILVAHLGLAKSDLGTGYELGAITAVVLGGTSVFGGRGTLFGSLLGLVFLSVLQNGMHLVALPSELTGVFTGALLLGIVGFEQSRALRSHRTRRQEGVAATIEVTRRRRIALWGGAVVAIAILAAAFPIIYSRLDAGEGERRGRIDGNNARCRMRRGDERDMAGAGQRDVGGKTPLADDEAAVLAHPAVR